MYTQYVLIPAARPIEIPEKIIGYVYRPFAISTVLALSKAATAIHPKNSDTTQLKYLLVHFLACIVFHRIINIPDITIKLTNIYWKCHGISHIIDNSWAAASLYLSFFEIFGFLIKAYAPSANHDRYMRLQILKVNPAGVIGVSYIFEISAWDTQLRGSSDRYVVRPIAIIAEISNMYFFIMFFISSPS